MLAKLHGLKVIRNDGLQPRPTQMLSSAHKKCIHIPIVSILAPKQAYSVNHIGLIQP